MVGIDKLPVRTGEVTLHEARASAAYTETLEVVGGDIGVVD